MPTTSIAKIRRRARVEELWLEGCTVSDICRRTGYGRKAVAADLAIMSSRLEKEQDSALTEKRAQAVARKEHLLRTAYHAFNLSQQPEEEIKTEYQRNSCEPCEGRGRTYPQEGGEGVPCTACEGRGWNEVEVITRKVKGQAGDAALLSVIRQTLGDIDKITGIHAAKEVKVSGQVEHSHTANNPYEDLPTHKLRELRQRLEEAKAATPRIEPAQDAIDVDFEKTDNNAERENGQGSGASQESPDEDW